jgi:hypothetical protein
MTLAAQSTSCIDLSAAELERLCAVVRSCNPFIDNRINTPATPAADVENIHRAPFERLMELARDAHEGRRGVGAMLWGEAGIGKSHLLSRLVRWAEQDGHACAVYLHNLQASPENLPRSLLRAVISILTRGQTGRFGRTPLFHLSAALIREAVQYREGKYQWPAIERAYRMLIDRLSAEAPSRAALVDRTQYDVIYRFFRSAYRAAKTGEEREAALAIRWLSGDYLDPDEARQLKLPCARTESVALADNQEIKLVLVALCRLAQAHRQPFLLCLDQVDNLDDDQAAALARFLEALLDSAPNLLVVTAGIQATLLRWREVKVIQDSAWDRLAQFKVALQRLTPQEARSLVAARLAPFRASVVDVCGREDNGARDRRGRHRNVSVRPHHRCSFAAHLASHGGRTGPRTRARTRGGNAPPRREAAPGGYLRAVRCPH